MRWLVEVTSIDKTEAQSVLIEAESWQRALQAARAQRGETGPISGFSIELVDEGYRAVDPMARLRYLVKKAPDTAVAPSPGASAPVPPPAPPRPTPSVAPPPVALAAPTAQKPAGGSLKSTMVGGVAAAAAKVPAAPESLPDADLELDTSADETIKTEALQANALPAFPAPAAPPPVAPPPVAPAPVAPPVTRSVPPSAVATPPTQVIFKREHDPTERIPLTYREYVYAVARGVDEVAAERLLRAQLENVKASIQAARPGKFVNMAVFDVVFQGRPPFPPLATLAWKDWRGEPTVAFPRRPESNGTDASHGHAHAPPADVIPPAPAAFVPPPPAFVPPPAISAPPAPAPAPPPPSLAPPSPPPPAASVPAPFVMGAADVQIPPPPAPVAPPPASVPPPSFVVPSIPAPAGFVPTAPPSAAVLELAPTAIKVPPPPPPQAPPQPRPAPSALGMTPTPGRAMRPLPSPRRAQGDELIADLFEAMHELHFARDAVEGAEFVLGLAMEMLPSRAALVHFYDIDHREFVTASAVGPGAAALLLRRLPENEPLLEAAMRRRRALVLGDAREGDAASTERYALLGGARSVVVSPVMLSGRYLGVIELVNPNDGLPFTENEGNAVDYLSEQFAEFLATRGVVLDPDRIGKSAAAAAAR